MISDLQACSKLDECVYRHPHSKLESFHEAMKVRLQSSNNSSKQVIVLGEST